MRDFNQEWDAENIAVNTFIPWSFMDQKTYEDNDARMSHIYCLKREHTNVLADNPVRSTELTQMTFDWDRLEVPPPDPTKLKGITVRVTTEKSKNVSCP